MNIDGLKQIAIEAEFDINIVRNEVREQIRVYADDITEYYPQIDDLMSVYLDNVEFEDIDKVVIAMLTILGNDRAGITLGIDRDGNIKSLGKGMRKISAKDIPFNVFVKTLYKDKFIQKVFGVKAIEFVMDIVVELDTIFFDVIKRVELIDDGQFRTLTYIRSELHFNEDVSLRAKYERFRLPLIEEPLDWSETSNGGYHLHQSRCITNMGNTSQHQNVLDILNKLQSQSYTHNMDIQREYQFNFDKFIKDGNPEKIAIDKAKALALTCQETYDAIGDKQIWFQWQFGANGRMYPTGYDIHLHGNKAKKGALRPVL